MRFRCCCAFDDKEEPNTVQNTQNRRIHRDPVPQRDLPVVITQQPKQETLTTTVERVPEVPAKEPENILPPIQEERPNTSQEKPQIIKEVSPPPVKTVEKIVEEDPYHAQVEAFKERLRQNIAASRAENPTPPEPQPTSNGGSNFNVESTINGERVFFTQILPNIYQGTFKGSQFYIINGSIVDDNTVYDESERSGLKYIYDEAMKGMQLGMKELAGGVSALEGQEGWNPPPGSSIKTNYTTRRGQQATMTFKKIGQGHFQSNYEGKDFVILNGRILADQDFDEEDRDLIFDTYLNTLLGMQKGLEGMQQRMQTMQSVTRITAQGGTAGVSVSAAGTTVKVSSGGQVRRSNDDSSDDDREEIDYFKDRKPRFTKWESIGGQPAQRYEIW